MLLALNSFFRFAQELIYVIAIIGILSICSINSYLPCITKAHVISIAGIFGTTKITSQVYYALNGEWPDDISQLDKTELDDFEIETKNGAISFTFSRREKTLFNKTITLRPVVQNNNPFGPVHWVCGDKDGESGWKIFGVDRTDLEERYINNFLR